jgi:hypothetical protein
MTAIRSNALKIVIQKSTGNITVLLLQMAQSHGKKEMGRNIMHEGSWCNKQACEAWSAIRIYGKVRQISTGNLQYRPGMLRSM